MKKAVFLLTMVAALLASGTSKAQSNDDFQPHGKPVVTLFEHAGIHYDGTNGFNNPGFELERAYFGYKYFFDPKWSATVIFDASEGNGSVIEHAFVKNAFVQYNNHGFTAMVGMIPTDQGLLPEKYWGYRYVSKAFYDRYGWGASADLGFELKYRPCDWFQADFSMLNGEGFKNVQLDEHFLYALGLTFTPIEHLDLRVYADIKPTDTLATQQNLAFFAGYDHQYFTVGAEYNLQYNNKNVEDHNMSGISLSATGKLCDKTNIFARYDKGASKDLTNNGWNYGKDGELLMFGMQYKFNKLISVAPALCLSGADLGSGSWYGYLSAKVAF